MSKAIFEDSSFFLIAGPCVIESESLVFEIAQELKEITDRLKIPFIFKASYDKANRTSLNSFRGPGLDKGLAILERVSKQLEIPVLSDIHNLDEVEEASKILDVLQIPAFLCRQTDLLVKAAQTDCILNIKKGQFLAPWDMKNVLDKVLESKKTDVFLTERGNSFGYNNLVSDMRSIPTMKKWGRPVVFDATHSVQLPGGKGSFSSGQREFAPLLAYAATSVGCDGLFFETHPEPDKALSDGPNMIPLGKFEPILKHILALRNISNGDLPCC
ncbi:3-deoxy-8-phosphooctulonate synthase [PVC group bacterium (ex Bugula neritina AB1)]|nr:3-deoxy-8-phosphooctulonate synthase [PVC group bacterium (ex Bugula neritina AB1)]